MVGFPLGARGCERYGRIPTIFVAGMMTALGALAFYWGPPAHLGLRWFYGSRSRIVIFTAALSAGQVGGNSLGTELFPTAIRGAMMGWFALIGAAAAISAQTLIAVLAAQPRRPVYRGWLPEPARDTQRDHRRAVATRDARPLAGSRRDGRSIPEIAIEPRLFLAARIATKVQG